MEQPKELYKWNNLINIQLFTALFYVFSGAVMAKRTQNKIDNIAIFIIFTGAIIIGLLGYGESFSKFKESNQIVMSAIFLSLGVWSHMDVLFTKTPDTYLNIVSGTIIGTMLLYVVTKT
jgi:hypothetical protein